MPMCENESTCETFHMKMWSTDFHVKGFTQGLVLKQTHKETWKWPILVCNFLFVRVSFNLHWSISIHVQ